MKLLINRGKGFSIIELLIVLAIIMILIGLLLTGLDRAKKNSLKMNCQSNLRQIGISIKTYQNDYKQAFPDKLSFLGTVYIDNVQVFKCPGSKTSVTSPANGDYGYNKNITEVSPSNTPMASDKVDTYHPAPKKVNVLHVDGHVSDSSAVSAGITNPD